MIFVHVMCNGTTVLHLIVKQRFKNIFIRHICDSRKNLIPIGNEDPKIVSLQCDTKQILKCVCCPVFHVGGKVVMHHEKHLSSTNHSIGSSFSLLESVDLASEITCDDVGQCRQQLCIEGSKRRNLPERIESLVLFPNFTDPVKRLVWLRGRSDDRLSNLSRIPWTYSCHQLRTMRTHRTLHQ